MVHLLEPLSFRPRCSSFLLSKFVLHLKLIQSVVRVSCYSQDTTNLCHKFSLQDPGLRILDSSVPGVRVSCPSVPGLRVLSPRVQVPECQGPGCQVPRPLRFRVSGFWVLGLRVAGPRSQVSGFDFRLCL